MSKIVIIEDNALVARIYENKFRTEGNQVVVAFDGESGIETVKNTRPDLVLVDLMLPNMSGVEVIRKLRREPAFANLPIVAYSSADEEMLQAVREASPTALFSKNVMSPKELYANVCEVLRTSRVWETVYEPNLFGEEPPESEQTKPQNWERVLVVEDDPLIAAIVKHIVEKLNYTVVLAVNGSDAYRILSEESNFAAGIFDIELPVFSGIDLIKYMRTEKRLRQIPVMAMTASDSIRVQLDSHDAGAALFIPKPFERATFEQMFFSLVGKGTAKAAR